MLSLQPTELADFVSAEPQAQLLDVREPWELQQCRIDLPGARSVHIVMHEVPARLQELDTLQPVVCICHHGVRSAQVVAFLQHQGFSRAYNLAGGVDAWSLQVDSGVPRY